MNKRNIIGIDANIDWGLINKKNITSSLPEGNK